MSGIKKEKGSGLVIICKLNRLQEVSVTPLHHIITSLINYLALRIHNLIIRL